MRSLCAKVPKEKGELFRKILNGTRLINKQLIIKANEKNLFIPLHTQPTSISGLERAGLSMKDIDFIDYDFESYPDRLNNYKSLY